MSDEIKNDVPVKEPSEIEILQKRAEENLHNYKRALADLANYKKDEMTRLGALIGYTKEGMFFNLLPILDNIDLAEKHLPEDKYFVAGFTQLRKQIEEFLKKEGIEEIKAAGEKLNLELMEIVYEDENGEPGMVTEVLRKGYMLNGRVLRPAQVKVGK